MILFLLVLTLVARVHSAATSREIDWNRCLADGNCFVQGRCYGGILPDETSQYYYELEHVDVMDKLKDLKCPIGVQVIPVSSTKIIIFMQVIGEVLEQNEIGLYEDGKIVVGCKQEEEKSVEIIHNELLKNKAKPVLYDTISYFKQASAFCAVMIPRFNTFLGLYPSAGSSNRIRKMKYYPKNKVVRTPPLPVHGEIPYKKNVYDGAAVYDIQLCDPALIKPGSPQQNYHVMQIKDPARREVDCDNYAKDLNVPYKYSLIIMNGNEEEEVDKLQCKNRIFNALKGGVPIPIPNQADFRAYCRTNIAKRCLPPPCSGVDCPKFTPATATENPKLECVGDYKDKWLINNVYYEGVTAECNQDDLHANVSSFYVNSTKISEHDRCFNKYSCKTKSNLIIGPGVNEEEDTMYCMKEMSQMIVYTGDSNINATGLVCNKTEGVWMNGTYKIQDNSRVLCDEKQNTTRESQPIGKAALSDGQVAGIIAAIFVVVLIVVAVVASITYKFCLGRNSRNIFIKRKIKKWRSLKPNKRRKMAAEIFNNASIADRTSKTHIMHGLKLLDQMLMTECEDPAAWALAYPFLDRFHGASRTRGNRMTGLFARYLYLQAKRIIDKHGWTSPTPITKTLPKGYIRAVAVRLIFYCRFNAYTPEITKFIGEGFEKLYDAVAQYPHCGLLWAHVATFRNNAFQKQFIQDLKDISLKKFKVPMEIDEADRFPDIGDICEQAYYAFGGSLVYEPKEDIFNTTNNITLLPFVNGILRSSHLDMGITMRKLFCFKDKKLLTLKRVVGEEKIHKLMNTIIRTIICYGQGQEAKRFENLYLNPDVKLDTEADLAKFKEIPPADRFLQMTGEQKRFEGALSQEENDILDWLAERMDKTALKDPLANHHKVNLNTAADMAKSESVEAPKAAPETAYDDIDPKTGLLTEAAFFSALIKDQKVIPRIRKCTATEDEQKRYRALLDQIFHSDTRHGMRIDFVPDDIMEIVLKMKDIVKTEPMIIEDIPAGITVVTDIHGQIADLERVFETKSVDGKPGYDCANFMFLGDYVDRGDQSLEVVMALFIVKILHPDKIFVLRGNHEFSAVNKGNGLKSPELRFLDEICQRYGPKESLELYLLFNECFSYLSLAGIIGDKFFCVHGGISMESFTRHEMRRLEKPVVETIDPIIADMMWSDPALDLKGVCYQSTRKAAFFYGEDEFNHAMENIGCEAVIRGHQVMAKGFEIVWNRVFSLFTATGNIYDGPTKYLSSGAIAYVDENLDFHCRLLEGDMARYSIEKSLLKQPCDDTGAVSTRETGVG